MAEWREEGQGGPPPVLSPPPHSHSLDTGAPGHMQKQLRGGGESFRNGRQKGTTSEAVDGGQSLSSSSPSNPLAIASLALAPGCCYIFRDVCSFTQPANIYEHLLFVENLFVNSTMQTTNLLIKYLLFIHLF